MAAIITLLVLVLIAGVLIHIYNKLVRSKNQWQNSFAQIEVQLKRRYDLIPNLVTVAKAYLQHENQSLTAVTQARNQALAALQAAHNQPQNPAALAQMASSEQKLSGALQGLNVQIEAYPELKASENLKQLTEEISSTENRVSFARQAYNDDVMDYNTLRQSFPFVLFASLFGHAKDAVLLQFKDSELIQGTPKVNL
ncbi:LemA family protein [Stenoxybacter acetivorans]|uniref:LemA family protein n=1 Tax=Stenoxybacter acetivorans TaxID=422441 RepID=UPI00055AC180|nr:LemA family protein [Stenoxybacter acetivorans]